MASALLKSLKKFEFKSAFRIQLNIFRIFLFGSISIQCSSNPCTILETCLNTKSVLFLKVAKFAHNTISILKGICLILTHFKTNSALTGNNLMIICFWIVPTSLGHLFLSFLLDRSYEVVSVCNSIYLIPYITSSYIIRFIVFSPPALTIGTIALYSLVVCFANIDPIVTFSNQYTNLTSYSYIILRIVSGIYEVWNFGLLSNLGCILIYQVMFPVFISLSIFAERASKSVTNSCYWSISKLNRSMQMYRVLQVHTRLINHTFQNKLALPLKVTLMFCTVLLGTVLLNTGLRHTLSTTSFLLSLCISCNLYIFMSIGYSFPGRANRSSRIVINLWKNIISGEMHYRQISKRTSKQYRMYIKSCKDLRIYFGAMNYYESGTALKLLKFVLEATINLVLVI